MKKLSKLIRRFIAWSFGESNAPQSANARNTLPTLPLSSQCRARSAHRKSEYSHLSVVERLDALPESALRTMTQAELAKLVGCASSGVSVYRSTRGIVSERMQSRRRKSATV